MTNNESSSRMSQEELKQLSNGIWKHSQHVYRLAIVAQKVLSEPEEDGEEWMKDLDDGERMSHAQEVLEDIKECLSDLMSYVDRTLEPGVDKLPLAWACGEARSLDRRHPPIKA